jgi:hypothetical protein
VAHRGIARVRRKIPLRVTRLIDFSDAVGARAAKDDNIQQRVGAEAVGAVDGCAGRLASGEETRNNCVRVSRGGPEALAEVVGGDAAHIVVHRRQDGDGLFGHVHAGEDGGRLRDAREALGEHLWRQVIQVQVDVVVLRATAAALHDLHGHRARDDVPRRKIFCGRRVSLHETLALAVPEDAALAAGALCDQAAGAIDAGRVELDELEVLERQPGARSHRAAVASARVCRSGRVPRATVAARRQHGVLALEAMQAARGVGGI